MVRNPTLSLASSEWPLHKDRSKNKALYYQSGHNGNLCVTKTVWLALENTSVLMQGTTGLNDTVLIKGNGTTEIKSASHLWNMVGEV